MPKEYTLRLFETLKNGLRREKAGSRNTNFLAECHNAKPTENGLEQPTDIVRRLSFDAFEWPFPQVFRGQRITLLAKDQAVYAIDEDEWDTATNIGDCGDLFDISARTYAETSYLYDLDIKPATAQDGPINTIIGKPTTQLINGVSVLRDTTHEKEIVTGGGAWHFIDMGEAWMLLNENNVIIRSPNIPLDYFPGYQDALAAYTDRNGAFISTRYPTSTGCYFKGRVLTAGFDETKLNDYWGHLKENEVSWSSIGGGDVFFPYIKGLKERGMTMKERHGIGHTHELGSTVGNLHSDFYHDMTAGHRAMPFSGPILKLLPLDQYVIVYGQNGICALRHFAEPTSTFGIVPIPRLIRVGLANRSAVFGNDEHHMLVDRTGAAWVIEKDLSIDRLDYKEYLEAHKDTIVVNHDPEEDEFYLASRKACYALNTKTELEGEEKYSMYSTNQCVTSVHRIDGELVGTMFTLGNKSVELTSQDMDMGTQAIKNVGFVDVGISGNADVEVAWEYRDTMDEPFVRTEFEQLSPRGTTRIGCSFLVGRLVLRTGLRDRFDDINYIDIHYTIPDRRSVRGARANIIDGGSSSGQMGRGR